MTDYGHELLFGTLLAPPPGRPQDVVDLAVLCEEAGLDLVSLSDQPYRAARLDTLALLAAITVRTSRITVLSNLAHLPLRPPAVLARTAATLDVLGGGRFELGLAPGDQAHWDAVLAEDGPRRTPGESVEALGEAVRLIRELWGRSPDHAQGSRVWFEGGHYRLEGAEAGPSPVHDMGVWLGAHRPRTLRLTGRLGDGWVPNAWDLPPERLPAAGRVVDEAAAEAGRGPEEIRRAYNIPGGPPDAGGAGQRGGAGGGLLAGPTGARAERLAELALAEGVSVFVLAHVADPDAVRWFASEVAPAVRDLVRAERS